MKAPVAEILTYSGSGAEAAGDRKVPHTFGHLGELRCVSRILRGLCHSSLSANAFARLRSRFRQRERDLMKTAPKGISSKVLVVDIGGTHIKLLAMGQTVPIKIASGPTMTAEKMVHVVK